MELTMPHHWKDPHLIPKKVRRRYHYHRLFVEQEGKCHYCKCAMQHGPGPQGGGAAPRNLATIEHLDDRLSEDRGKFGYGTRRVVLACWQCNFERGRQRQAEQPLKVIWEKSGRKPEHMRGVGSAE